MKTRILSALKASGLAALSRGATDRHLRILAYHGLWTTPGPQYGDKLFMPPEQFARRMERLASSRRPVLSLREAVESLGRDDLRAGATVITIDDGWASTYSHMLPILESLGLPATIYVTTWYVDNALPITNKAVDYLNTTTGGSADWRSIERLPKEQRLSALRTLSKELGVDPDIWLSTRQFNLMTPEEIADAAERGFDIQLHTHRHIDVRADIAHLADEVEENRRRLLSIIGKDLPLDQFCYPSGTCHPAAEDVLARLGIRSAVLVDEGLNAPRANPYHLRRFLDGRSVSDIEFDAYLDGTAEQISKVRRIIGR